MRTKVLRSHWLIERLCRAQHEAYERAAIEEGWITNPDSRVPWDQVPAANKRTMRKSIHAVLDELESMGML